MCNYTQALLPTPLCLGLFTHLFLCLLPQFVHGVSSSVILSDGPSFKPSGAVNSSHSLPGFGATGAWHALCFSIGVAVFVPERELETRVRPLCTCVPFTPHLISPPLCLSDTLGFHFKWSKWKGRFLEMYAPVLSERITRKSFHHHPAQNEPWRQGETDLYNQEARNQNL